jgi:uncharacterized protein (DUF2147 family)
MKKIKITLLLSFVGLLSFAQRNADLVGEWHNDKEDVVITIFEVNQTISAKITWMRSPNDKSGNPKTDLLNPDESLRATVKIGLIMMSNFSHIAGNIWDNGTLYISKKGKTYSGMMRLKDENTLNIRGYIGFSFFERYSSTWTRVLDRDKFRNKNVEKENLLTQLRQDLNKIVKIIEDISLKPAAEIIRKIENENLLIQIKEDLNKIMKKIEELKKTE